MGDYFYSEKIENDENDEKDENIETFTQITRMSQIFFEHELTEFDESWTMDAAQCYSFVQ